MKVQPFTGQGAFGVFVRGDTLDTEHASLNDLVIFAYNLRDVQLSGGPAWAKRDVPVSSELFQVIAKAAGDPPPPMDAFRQMLQSLLAERFKLQVHHARKNLPVYNLMIDKGGPKLKPSASDAKRYFTVAGVGSLGVRIVATHMTVQELIDLQLSAYATRPIFDKTGLDTPCDFTLQFVGENLRPEQEPSLADGPPLTSAVREQLGLRLESSTTPFDTVVIDRAERPTEN